MNVRGFQTGNNIYTMGVKKKFKKSERKKKRATRFGFLGVEPAKDSRSTWA